MGSVADTLYINVKGKDYSKPVMDSAAKNVDKVGKAGKKAAKDLGDVEKTGKKATQAMAGSFRQLAGAYNAMIVAKHALGAMQAMVQPAIQLETAQTRMAIAAGLSTKEVERLTEAAKVGAELTPFGLQEGLAAATELAMKFRDINTVVGLTPKVMSIATTYFNSDLEEATKAVGLFQAALGTSAGEMSDTLDKWVTGSQALGIQVKDTAGGLKYLGTAMTRSNTTFEDAFPVYALTAKGLGDATQAGNSMKTMTARLVSDRRRLILEEELGIKTLDKAGKQRGLQDIMLDLAKSYEMNKDRAQAWQNTVTEVFGERGILPVLVNIKALQTGIMDTSGVLHKGAGAYALATRQMSESSGAVADQTARMAKDTFVMIDAIVQSTKAFAAEIGKAVLPYIKSFVWFGQKLIAVLDGIFNSLGPVSTFLKWVGGLLLSGGGALLLIVVGAMKVKGAIWILKGAFSFMKPHLEFLWRYLNLLNGSLLRTPSAAAAAATSIKAASVTMAAAGTQMASSMPLAGVGYASRVPGTTRGAAPLSRVGPMGEMATIGATAAMTRGALQTSGTAAREMAKRTTEAATKIPVFKRALSMAATSLPFVFLALLPEAIEGINWMLEQYGPKEGVWDSLLMGAGLMKTPAERERDIAGGTWQLLEQKEAAKVAAHQAAAMRLLNDAMRDLDKATENLVHAGKIWEKVLEKQMPVMPTKAKMFLEKGALGLEKAFPAQSIFIRKAMEKIAEPERLAKAGKVVPEEVAEEAKQYGRFIALSLPLLGMNQETIDKNLKAYTEGLSGFFTKEAYLRTQAQAPFTAGAIKKPVGEEIEVRRTRTEALQEELLGMISNVTQTVSAKTAEGRGVISAMGLIQSQMMMGRRLADISENILAGVLTEFKVKGEAAPGATARSALSAYLRETETLDALTKNLGTIQTIAAMKDPVTYIMGLLSGVSEEGLGKKKKKDKDSKEEKEPLAKLGKDITGKMLTEMQYKRAFREAIVESRSTPAPRVGSIDKTSGLP